MNMNNIGNIGLGLPNNQGRRNNQAALANLAALQNFAGVNNQGAPGTGRRNRQRVANAYRLGGASNLNRLNRVQGVRGNNNSGVVSYH